MAKSNTSPSSSVPAPPSVGESFGLNRYRFTASKLALVLAAVAMIVVGVVGSMGSNAVSSSNGGSAAAGGTDLTRTLAPNGASSLAQPFVETFPNTQSSVRTNAAAEERSLLEQWSPSLVRGGFSMFIGFAMGYAIRAFMKLATIIIGGYFLVLTLMAYAGWVEIHWTVIEGQFDRSVASLEAQFSSFKAFLMGSIPSAGLGALGLASGLRQK